MAQKVRLEDIEAINKAVVRLEDAVASLSKEFTTVTEETKSLGIKVLDDSGEQVKDVIDTVLVPTMNEGIESMKEATKVLKNTLIATGNM